MPYLGSFIPEFVRNIELIGKQKEIKKASLDAARRYGAGYSAVEASFQKKAEKAGDDAAHLAAEIGVSPDDEQTISKMEKAAVDEYARQANVRKGKLNTAYENIRSKKKASAQEFASQFGLNSAEAEGFAEDSWDLSIPEKGVGSALRQAASDRATALNITRFRATDGAMDTLDSIKSLFYKDNYHFSKMGHVAFWGGTVAGSYGLLTASAAARDSLGD